MFRRIGFLKSILIFTITLLLFIIILANRENPAPESDQQTEKARLSLKDLQKKKEFGSDLKDVLSEPNGVFPKRPMQPESVRNADRAGKRRVHNQDVIKTDSLNSLANFSSQFRTSFCKHTLKPVPTAPKMCLFDSKVDQYISKMVERGTIWDKRGVATVLTHLVHVQREIAERGQDPISQLLFLDLGANIGTFTLPALSYGVPTISVEPLHGAMERLATSIDMNNFQLPTSLPLPSSMTSSKRSQLSTLHRKAVSDKQGCVKSKVNQLNKGGSEVVQVDCNGEGSDDDGVLRSVTVDDLVSIVPLSENTINVVIKMDVQGFEPYALKGASSLLFDNRFNVSLIYMEWAEMRLALGQCNKQKQVSSEVKLCQIIIAHV
ncbi:uncharacterized protein LOC142352853 [Convolutriloba macropyga]|uniref:uncharacterized protein LOC142352853 n=1 Tax=Convolutriloba macropyga TaxID=536237 RepID=UPI003F525EBC